jgi:hypothetical protein
MILVWVLIGKVVDPGGLARKVKGVTIVNDNSSWNCVEWVKDCLAVLKNEKKIMRTCNLDWKTVTDAALTYCEQKKDQGRFN